ncbi:MAG TPA: MSMEG_4193 family putative phosphomutase, partial [Streptosporangiaceae bacterium]|nr:MSMEG_4193 family putative phosphomutase [Streptosporangiaceae bacterium]
MTLVLVVRHGLTAATGTALSGRTPGIPLDDRGRAQAAAVAKRLAQVRLDAIISSPLERCAQTAAAIAEQQSPAAEVTTEDRLIEVGYGDWTGQSLRKLSREPLWRVVQAHPSAVTFPGPGGEALPDMERRAVSAIRDWNARLGPEAVYLICSHADVIKAILADSLGLHLDLYQRIQIDPCSLSAIRFTPLRPFVERMNDTGGSVKALTRSDKTTAGTSALRPGDAPVGGGAGG